jgi:putative two-component system response regulator
MIPYAGFIERSNPSALFVEDGSYRFFIMQEFLKTFNIFNGGIDHSNDILLTLSSSLEAKDPYTKEHSTRVSNLSSDFISFLGFSQKHSEDVRKAGILHDIGKIFLSTSLLLKPGVLTEEETEAIKRHVVFGEEICKPLVSMRSILPAIRNHHERWDGRGFPDGLAGEDIPVIARILAIVDSFDAMVSERSYRGCKSAQGALETMKSEQYKGQWDPELLGYFIEMMSFMKGRVSCQNG